MMVGLQKTVQYLHLNVLIFSMILDVYKVALGAHMLIRIKFAEVHVLEVIIKTVQIVPYVIFNALNVMVLMKTNVLRANF